MFATRSTIGDTQIWLQKTNKISICIPSLPTVAKNTPLTEKAMPLIEPWQTCHLAKGLLCIKYMNLRTINIYIKNKITSMFSLPLLVPRADHVPFACNQCFVFCFLKLLFKCLKVFLMVLLHFLRNIIKKMGCKIFHYGFPYPSYTSVHQVSIKNSKWAELFDPQPTLKTHSYLLIFFTL